MQMYFGVFYIGIKVLFEFRYRSFFEGEEWLYIFALGTKELFLIGRLLRVEI